MVIAVVVAVVFASRVFPDLRLGGVVCGVLASLAAIVTFIWMPLAVLDVRGVAVSAVVTAEHVVPGRHNLYEYKLRDPDGRPVAGVLIEYGDVYKVGDRVSVVVDPGQQLDPATADELGRERATGLGAAGLVALTTVLSVAVGSRADMKQIEIRIRCRYRRRH